MPSPLRKDNNSVAYTRWEAVESEENHGDLELPFHQFQEEPPPAASSGGGGVGNKSSASDRRSWAASSSLSSMVMRSGSRSSNNSQLWTVTVKSFYILIVFGLGWIFGFLVRWGVHKYYIDPMGHCEAPLQYRYSAELAKLSIDVVHVQNISKFFEEFTASDGGGNGGQKHLVGSKESLAFAHKIANLWTDYGMPKVEVETVKVKVPAAAKIPTEIVVKDPTGKVMWRVDINNGKGDAEVLYSANAISEGHLVYGHFGRFQDLNELSPKTQFKDSVVLLRISPMFHTGTMVRNAQIFGAKAVILFPDPFYYKLIDNGTFTEGGITANTSLSLSVKFFPGDPESPYLGGWNRNNNSDSTPRIPVTSISFAMAKQLLADYAHTDGVSKSMTYGIPGGSMNKVRNFTASVEVNTDFAQKNLQNVIGTLPGKYEPTRYVIIGSHHDTWQQGLSKPGIGHSVLMELARALGVLVRFGWRPGRSIILASWDGEEMGNLGSNDWLHKHSKELSARAVAYINLDYAIEGVHGPIAASPIFRKIIEIAAKSVHCTSEEDRDYDEDCNLHEIWLDDQQPTESDEETIAFDPGNSAFQNIFGISTMDVALRMPDTAKKVLTDKAAETPGDHNLASVAKHYLDPQFKYSAMVTKFALVVVLQMVMSPDVPLQAVSYGKRIHDDVHDYFRSNGVLLDANGVKTDDFFEAVTKFEIATGRFHSTYNNQSIRLEFLGHHEFSDQLLELERAFLAEFSGDSFDPLLRSPFRHALYGPSPLNPAEVSLFPRLTAAMAVAKARKDSDNAWEQVRKEAFFAVDALESAACVLDNHLVYTYPN